MHRSTLCLALAFVACGNAKGKEVDPKGSDTPIKSTVVNGQKVEALPVTRDDGPEEKPKGDREDKGDWIPAEFKTGAARWKDSGVYLDGQPIAFLNFGELPTTLKPTWVQDKVSANKRPHSSDPGWRWKQQRFYKFSDYLASLGIDVHKVKAIHVYGMKFTQSIVVLPKDIAAPSFDGFMFHFGSEIAGKGIPKVPRGFANGKQPDKISSVMIYVNKTPPTLDPVEGFMLDGHPIDGVPYYGEPPRGGVRIYLDDKLATIIKRQELDPKLATKTPDGELHWGLYDFLKSKGVDTKKVVEGWLIREELRKERIPAADLATITFTAGSKSSGGVLLGDKKLGANVIALHSHVLTEAELPHVTDDEL